jgi:hypothetical protein
MPIQYHVLTVGETENVVLSPDTPAVVEIGVVHVAADTMLLNNVTA